MPLRWDELDDDLYPTRFDLRNAAERLEQRGDVWAKLADARVDLRQLLDA